MQKKLMTTFSNNFRNPTFGPFFAHFVHFWGVKNSQKIRNCNAQLDMGFQNHAKI